MFRHAVLRLFPTSSTAALVRLCMLAVLCLGAASVLPATASANNYSPVAEYSFDEVTTEGEVETVEDLSGEGHTATVHGAKWTPKGRYGGAMEFDGAESDFLSIPASEELDGTTEEFTIEAWVRPTASPSRAAILTKERAGGGPRYSYELLQHEEEPLGEFMESEEGLLEGDEDAVPSDTWTHLAITDDGAYLRLYVNGELEDTSLAVPVEGDGELRIGGNGIGGEYFTGRIDEMRIYDRVLGQAEVATDMETPIQTPKAGPVADWSFDQNPGEGTTTEDNTGNEHTATIHGAKWSPAGKYGGAMEFKEGTYLSVPASPELDLTEEFTLEAWIHPEAKHEFDSILTKESGESSSKFAYLMADHNGQFASYYGKYAHSYYSPGEEIKRHIWTHVAIVDDGARIHLYLNGEEVESGPAYEIISTPSGELRIGSSQILEDFIGRIDEVRIYGRALNQGEVANDMEAPIQTPKAGPVAAYAFDEGEEAGETVTDVTGDEHNATIEDGTRGDGRYGGGIEFDGGGGNECVSVPDSPELRLSEEFTLAAWVHPTGGVFEDPVVVREAGGKDVFGLGLGSRKEFAAEGFIGQGKGSEAAVGGEVRENEWTPVATTYDGSTIRVYEEGVLVAEKSALTPPLTGEGPLKIGCDGPDGQFTGGIDEVRVYNRALNGGEVAAVAETPLQTPKATPVASYSFDENNEETQADTSGDGHTATVEGAKWTEHGRYGGAMEFSAAEGDVLKIPASSQLNFTEAFTLEAWVRPSGEDNHSAPLIDKQEGSGNGYFLYEGGTVSDRPVGAASEEQEHIHADDPLPAKTWSHVALVFTGGRTYLYVDGKLIDNGAAEPVVTEEGELQIGGSTDTSDYFDGRVDEVRIYNRPLNPAEVGADMETPIQTPKQGPIAAWSFDEIGEGGTVEDLTGDGHTGTIEGAIPARGKYGEALQFDGENDVVKVPDSPEFALAEGFTLESWVRPESASNEWAPILAKAVGGGAAAHELAYWLYEAGHEPNVPFGGTESAPGEKNEALGEDPLPVNAWSHVALTYDGSQVALYVNGELVDCSPAPSPAPRVIAGELQIGAATESGDYFKGRIDEVRIYNRALNAAEVEASMGELPYTQIAEAYGTNESETVFAAKINPRGIETTYRFQYGLTTAYGQTAPEAPEVTEEPISANEAVEVEEWVGGLEPETTYHFRVVATNSTGTVVGEDQTVTTESAEPELTAFLTGKEKEEKKKKEEEKEEAREKESRKSWSGEVGMNWNGTTSDPPLTERLVASGAKMFRVPIGVVSNGNKELFERLAKAHIRILPDVVGIAGQNVGNKYPSVKVGTEARGQWENQLKKLLEEYGPEAPMWENPEIAGYAPTYWEIWNEPNFGSSGANGAGKLTEKEWAERYGELLEVSHNVFKNTDEKAKILFGGVLSVGQWDPDATPKQQPHVTVGAFIKNVAHYEDYDALAVHPYVFTGTDQTRAPLDKDVKRVAEKIKKNVLIARSALETVKKHWLEAVVEGGGTPPEEPRKQIWVTEFGWPVEGHLAKEDGHHRLVSPKVQNDLVNATFNMFKSNHGAAKHELNLGNLLYYNMEDNNLISPKPTKADLEKIEEEAVAHEQNGPAAARAAMKKWEESVKQARSWENHCGLRENTGGVGHEEGKLREAWGAFVAQAK
jgi:hypothetical protein